MFADDPDHPSLRFKKLAGYEDLWSVRISEQYRADGEMIGRDSGLDLDWNAQRGRYFSDRRNSPTQALHLVCFALTGTSQRYTLKDISDGRWQAKWTSYEA